MKPVPDSTIRLGAPRTAWLIETGNPPHYFGADGKFCNNVDHAEKFPTKAAAEKRATGMRTPWRAVEHQWS